MDTATTTTADELRTAATRVREAARGTAAGPWKASPVWSPDAAVTSAVYSHAHPTGTPESEVVASGQKRYRKGGLRNPCNAVWIALANPDLAEPLAAWLEEYAKWAADSIFDYEEGDGPVHESDYCDGKIGKNCRCFDRALAVARALDGGTR